MKFLLVFIQATPVVPLPINKSNTVSPSLLKVLSMFSINGVTTYTANGATYSDKEVITLKGMFPYNLARGYSATEAAKRWSKIDDYIADYQSGFFKNEVAKRKKELGGV